MNRFSGWFERESGYSLHRLPQKGGVTQCCGLPLKPSGKAAAEYLPGEGEVRLPLAQCARCGRWYLFRRDVWYPAGSLLKYRVLKEETDDGTADSRPGNHPPPDGGAGSPGI